MGVESPLVGLSSPSWSAFALNFACRISNCVVVEGSKSLILFGTSCTLNLPICCLHQPLNLIRSLLAIYNYYVDGGPHTVVLKKIHQYHYSLMVIYDLIQGILLICHGIYDDLGQQQSKGSFENLILLRSCPENENAVAT